MQSDYRLSDSQTGQEAFEGQNLQETMKSTRANLLQAVLNSLNWPVQHPIKILVLGLSGAGKSTLVEFIEKGAVIQKSRTPTLSFNRFKINFGNFKMVFIDAPGQQAYWKDWKKYLPAADGILFMVDSANFLYVNIVNSLVYEMLELHKTKKPVLFLANKQDLKNALEPKSIAGLMRFENHLPTSKIYGISAINGRGIMEAFKDFILEIEQSVTN